MFGHPRDAIWAFGVHLLTASGAFLAFLSLVATAEKQFAEAFLWMGIALAVDGVDGPLARKLEVKKWWPFWSGEMLDNVVDYVTFVMLPAFMLYQSGLMGKYLSFTAAAVIVISSAIYYADTRMKTKDYGFLGFPICWNMVVFVLFVVSPSETFSMIFVLTCAVLTFVPIIFVHPVRVKVWRSFTLAVLGLWAAAALVALYYNLDSPVFIDFVLIVSSIYLFCVGGVLQIMGRLH